MGTRSLTHFKDENNKTIVTIYRQFDGYPSGMGLDIAEFLDKITVVNGFGMKEEAGTHANGMGCLAAQFIKYIKDGIGNVYLYPPDIKDCWEEYTYRVKWDKEKGLLMNVNGGKYVTPKQFIKNHQ